MTSPSTTDHSQSPRQHSADRRHAHRPASHFHQATPHPALCQMPIPGGTGRHSDRSPPRSRSPSPLPMQSPLAPQPPHATPPAVSPRQQQPVCEQPTPDVAPPLTLLRHRAHPWQPRLARPQLLLKGSIGGLLTRPRFVEPERNFTLEQHQHAREWPHTDSIIRFHHHRRQPTRQVPLPPGNLTPPCPGASGVHLRADKPMLASFAHLHARLFTMHAKHYCASERCQDGHHAWQQNINR